MRSFGLVITLTVVLSSAVAQRTAEDLWTQRETGPDGSFYTSGFSTSNGDVVLAGRKESTAGRGELWLRRVRPTGTVVFDQTYPAPAGYVEWVRAAAFRLGAEQILVVGTVGTIVSNDLCLRVYNENGLLLNERIIDTFTNDSNGDIAQRPNGNVVLVYGQGAPDAVLTEIDTSLTTVWNRTVVPTIFSDVEIASNGDVTVALSESTLLATNEVLLNRYAPNGNIVYTKSIGDPNVADTEASITEAPDGSTYLSYVRSRLEPNEEVRITRFDAAGAFQWNVQVPTGNNLVRSSLGIGPTGDAIAQIFDYSGPDATVETRRYDSAGQLVWSTPVTYPIRNTYSSGSPILPVGASAVLSAPRVFDTLGHRGSLLGLADDGSVLFDYRYGPDAPQGSGYRFNGLVPAGGGRFLAWGQVNVGPDTDAIAQFVQAFLNQAPTQVAVRLGRLNRGTLASLATNDNDVYEVCKFFVPNQQVPPVNVEIEAVVGAGYPVASLSLLVASSATSTGLRQDVELWNWTTGQWTNSTTRNLTTTEAPSLVFGSVANHFDPATRRVRARLRVSAVAPVSQPNWCYRVDQAAWQITAW